MKNWSNDDLAKAKILDCVFSSMSIDEIKSEFGADLIVDKLKGVEFKDGPIVNALTELQELQSYAIKTELDLQLLKSDFLTLLRVMNKGMGDVNARCEFDCLKNRHAIY